MKKILFILFSVNFITHHALAQKEPVFAGTKYEDNGGMGDDQIDTWKYYGYLFITTTPGISRPIVTTSVYKQSNGSLDFVKNNELFGKNVPLITGMINSKLKAEFTNQKREEPNCYKEFYPIGINELSISIDKNNMYFEIVWDDSYTVDALSECFNPSTIAKFSLAEISNFIQPAK